MENETNDWVKCTQCLRTVHKPTEDSVVECDQLKCPYKQLLNEEEEYNESLHR